MSTRRARLLDMPLYATIAATAERIGSWEPEDVFDALDPDDIARMCLSVRTVDAAILYLNDPVAWRRRYSRKRTAMTDEQRRQKDRDRKRRERAAMTDEQRELVRARDRERQRAARVT